MPIAFVVTITVVGAVQLLRQGLGVPLPAIATVLAASSVLLWRASRRLLRGADPKASWRPGGGPAGTAPEGAGRRAVELLNVAFGLALAAVLTFLGLVSAP